MGAGIAASPHCAERRICRCSVHLAPPRKRFGTCFSILAHQLRRRFLSNCSLLRGARSVYRSSTRRIADPSTDPACRRTEALRQNRPMFCGPSWGNHSCVPLCSAPRRVESRVAQEAITSSGASSRLAPLPLRRASALPAGRDRTFGHLPTQLAVAVPPGRPGPPSRSPMHLAPRARVGEAKNAANGLWITGISGTSITTSSKPPVGCRSVPARLPRPGA
jgi:hypothetical protein